jgi:Protein of unknown function (DUF2442)
VGLSASGRAGDELGGGQERQAAEEDTATSVGGGGAMLHDVVKATYRGDYFIELEFDDGQRGVVDFSKYAERGGVFERFKDLAFFRSFSVNAELGALMWGDELDVAAETLYAEATGKGFPSWMDPGGESTAIKRLPEDSPRAPAR